MNCSIFKRREDGFRLNYENVVMSNCELTPQKEHNNYNPQSLPHRSSKNIDSQTCNAEKTILRAGMDIDYHFKPTLRCGY